VANLRSPPLDEERRRASGLAGVVESPPRRKAVDGKQRVGDQRWAVLQALFISFANRGDRSRGQLNMSLTK
jgi:hypothetical protein